MPGEQQFLSGAGKRAVQGLLLHEQTLHAVGFQFHPQRVHLVPLHIAEQRGGGGRLGDQPVVYPEQDHVFRVFPACAFDIAAGHTVE